MLFSYSSITEPALFISYKQNVCKKEEQMGNRLLTALGGLFVSNTDEDIRIEFTALEPGFQVKDTKVKVW